MLIKYQKIITCLVLFQAVSAFSFAQHRQSTGILVNESFADFMESFKSDTEFQLKRTVFPLKATFFQDFELEPLDTTISKDNFYHQTMTFRENCSYKTYKKNQHGEFNDKYRTYEILGKDNGICINYTFEFVNSKWYLIYVNDMSN